MTLNISSSKLVSSNKTLTFEHQDIEDAVGLDYIQKWTPSTPIFIFAQTGSGKNTFVENKIIKNMVKKKYSILLLSNRVALSRQAKKRIALIMDTINPGKDSYANEVERRSSSPLWLDELENFGLVTVKSYQSFLSKQNNLAEKYDFIVLDECHFFLADAKFNKFTYKILSSILERYRNAIRLYLTATPYEVFAPILKLENTYASLSKHEGEVLNVQNFNNEIELYNKYPAVIYQMKYAYNNINFKYIKVNKKISKDNRALEKYRLLLNLIKVQIDAEKTAEKSLEKWIIFVSNKDDGEALLHAIGNENADYIHADSKNDVAFSNLCINNQFEKKVLITTSVIDNGINIKDSALKHIAILIFDKVSFIQMLGRKRMNKNEKITVYLMEKSKEALRSRLQIEKRTLAYLENYKENRAGIVQRIFDLDPFFYYSGMDYPIFYNKFLLDKLSFDIEFLERVLFENEMNEEQKDIYDFGEKTIIEQLSWLGREDSFNPSNYLNDDEQEKQEAKEIERLKEFLDKIALKEKIPQEGKSNFFKTKGMSPNKILDFRQKFTDLYNSIHKREKVNDNEKPHGKKLIDTYLEEHGLLYEIVSSVVTLTKEEQRKIESENPKPTFWILKHK